MADLRIADHPAALAELAAAEFVHTAMEAFGRHRRVSVALAGGSTPIALYRLLSRRGHLVPPGPLPWQHIHLFWGDERYVPPEHPESNYGAAKRALLDAIAIPPENVHRVPTELPTVELTAERYEQELRAFFGFGTGELPRFDLVLLGMGADGHMASLFPHSRAFATRDRTVAAVPATASRLPRITLTVPVLNAAARVIFLVTGGDKAETLKRVVEGPSSPDDLPAQSVAPTRGSILWIVDRAAAAGLRLGSDQERFGFRRSP